MYLELKRFFRQNVTSILITIFSDTFQQILRKKSNEINILNKNRKLFVKVLFFYQNVLKHIRKKYFIKIRATIFFNFFCARASNWEGGGQLPPPSPSQGKFEMTRLPKICTSFGNICKYNFQICSSNKIDILSIHNICDTILLNQLRDGGDEEGGGVYEGGWEGAFYIVRRDSPCYSKISSIPQRK